MPDLWVDVDLAVKVPVNILPLLDDTDFKSIETAVVYNSAGLALTWNFVTTAGVVTGTAVTPTDGTGVYDWSEPIADKGMYQIEIPASGGASINNDTEGVGWFTGVATGVLPWRGPTIGFRRAALNDLLMDGSTASTNLEDFFDGTGYVGGTAKLTVNTTHVNGTAQTAGDIVAAVITNAAGTDIAADIIAVKADTAAILTDTAEIGAAGAGLTAVPWNATWDAEVESEANDALVANNLDHVALTATGIPAIPAGTFIDQIMDDGTAVYDRTTDSLQAIRDRGDAAWDTADVSALALEATAQSILTDTAVIGAAGAGLTAVPWNAAWDAEVQSEVDDALDTTVADSVPADGTRPTFEQALYMIWQFLAERSVSGTTVTVKKADGTTSLMTFTLNDATTPTSITRAT